MCLLLLCVEETVASSCKNTTHSSIKHSNMTGGRIDIDSPVCTGGWRGEEKTQQQLSARNTSNNQAVTDWTIGSRSCNPCMHTLYAGRKRRAKPAAPSLLMSVQAVVVCHQLLLFSSSCSSFHSLFPGPGPTKTCSQVLDSRNCMTHTSPVCVDLGSVCEKCMCKV